MKVSVFENLMEKAVAAKAATGSVNSVKIIFKKRKCKKFLAMANKDIKNFYKKSNLNDVVAALTNDNAVLSSKVFVMDAAEIARSKYEKVSNDKALAAVKEFSVWETYKELLCQKALKEAFPDKVLVDEETEATFKSITQKTHNLIVKARVRMSDRGLSGEFKEILANINTQLANYKTLIEVLK